MSFIIFPLGQCSLALNHILLFILQLFKYFHCLLIRNNTFTIKLILSIFESNYVFSWIRSCTFLWWIGLLVQFDLKLLNNSVLLLILTLKILLILLRILNILVILIQQCILFWPVIAMSSVCLETVVRIYTSIANYAVVMLLRKISSRHCLICILKSKGTCTWQVNLL